MRARLDPHPTRAFTLLDDWKIMPCASAVPSADPGQAAKHGEVLSCEPDGVQVVTVVGSLVMTSTSDPGSPPKPTAAWTSRQQVACGSQLLPGPGHRSQALGLGSAPARSEVVAR